MNRGELLVTIAGLIATFVLPWPAGGEALERRLMTDAGSIESAQPRALRGTYEAFGRVRTGPTEGIQPTR